MYTFTSSALVMQAGTSWNEIKFANDANRLTIRTNNSERMQVDDSGVNVSNGDLVVNTGDLQVTAGDVVVSSAASISDTSGSEILDLASNGGTAVNQVQITNHTTGNAPTVASTGDDSNIDLNLDTKGTGDVVLPDAGFKIQSDSKPLYLGAGDDATITYNGTDLVIDPQVVGTGDTLFSSGKVGIGTTSPGAKLDVNGAIHADSISFDGGTNVLDEYEEGTWTPTVSFDTPGDLSISYVSQTANYVRVGSVLVFRLAITFTPTYTTASGGFKLLGLPFTPAAEIGCVLQAQSSNLDYPGGAVSIVPLIITANNMKLRGFGSGIDTTTNFVSVTQMPTGDQQQLTINGYYFIN